MEKISFIILGSLLLFSLLAFILWINKRKVVFLVLGILTSLPLLAALLSLLWFLPKNPGENLFHVEYGTFTQYNQEELLEGEGANLSFFIPRSEEKRIEAFETALFTYLGAFRIYYNVDGYWLDRTGWKSPEEAQPYLDIGYVFSKVILVPGEDYDLIIQRLKGGLNSSDPAGFLEIYKYDFRIEYKEFNHEGFKELKDLRVPIQNLINEYFPKELQREFST